MEEVFKTAEGEFVVGTKYMFRHKKKDVWAKFVAYVPEAYIGQRSVFVCDGGSIILRCDNGRVYDSPDRSYDVIPEEYKEPEEFEYFINIYPQGNTIGKCVLWDNEKAADRAAKPGRIACIRIKGKEGDGLEKQIK